MPLYTIIILALVQGITEFLPVSSSGHLVLTHALLDQGNADLCWEENRLIDVAVHIGTLAAVLLYFRTDLKIMAAGITNPHSVGFGLFKNVLIASIPVLIAGFIVNEIKPSILCLVEIMAWTTLVFGIVLGLADRYGRDHLSLQTMKGKHALLIGLSQTLALVPGTSRSGITMTAARALGYGRTEAARFSLLLAIIAIAAAGSLTGIELAQSGDFALSRDALIAAFLAFLTGYIAIALMMRWLARASFMPFVIYRIILGGGLLTALYTGWL